MLQSKLSHIVFIMKHLGETDKLSFKSGDFIENIEKIDEDWYVGEIHGQKGLLPATHIKLIIL